MYRKGSDELAAAAVGTLITKEQIHD